MSLNYHYNLIYNDLKDTIDSFSWESQQTKLALKTALSCVTAIFLANLFKLNMPFWSGITALVIMRANVGASFSKGWMRTGGCTIGCILCLFFMGYIVQNPLLFSVFLFSGIFLSFYIGVRVRNGYFWAYMLANMALIGMISISNPYGTFPLHIAFYRAAEIFLGVLVSWFYNIILWPNYAGNQFKDNLNSLVSTAVSFQRDLIVHYSSGKEDIEEIEKKYSQIKSSLMKCKSILNDVDSENFLLKNEGTDYKTAIGLLENRIVNMGNIIHHFTNNGVSAFPEHFREIFEKLAVNMYKLSNIEDFTEKTFRTLIPDNRTFEFKKYYDPEASKKYHVSEVMFLYEFIYHLQSFCKDLKRMSNADVSHVGERSKSCIVNNNTDYINLNMFSFKLSLYIPSLINAVKGGLAILFTFWMCLWLQIPGGYANMSVAIIAVFGPQLDTLASRHKGFLRFWGCLFGGAAGLFVLLLNIDSGLIYFLVIFCFTSVSSYVFGARQGVAYIGLQSGLAFLVCVAAGFSPVTSIDSVMERLTGIFLAIGLMWIVNYIIWPENLLLRLKKKLSHLNDNFIKQIENLDISLARKDSPTEDVSAGIVDVNDVSSILNILEIQQDLPVEIIGNIKMSAMYISKISEKLYSVSQTSREVIDFVNMGNLTFLQTCLNSIISVIEINTEKEREELLNTLNRHIKQLDSLTLNIRTKGSLKNRDFSFKTEVSSLILVLKRILYDSMQLANIKIDFELLSE